MIELFILSNVCLSSSASLRKANIILSNLALTSSKATIVSSKAGLLEKVVLLSIVDVDRNMNDHEIVEQYFQEFELAMRDLTVGSMLGYKNQNSGHSLV
jgi:hypothetical protein